MIGDCMDVLKGFSDNFFHSCVTDPPYGLEFMGKEWDKFPEAERYGKWTEEWAKEVYRVLRPGAYVLIFGGSRTCHRMVCGIEDAGFEIRDTMMWLYGSGFPKSLDVSKAIDKAAGVEREVIGVRSYPREGTTPVTRKATRIMGGDRDDSVAQETNIITKPCTDAARTWQGWGTALKPAFEPIVLARKPLKESTVAKNVLKWGTGGVNVDGCRIPTESDFAKYWNRKQSNLQGEGWRYKPVDLRGMAPNGRWPANVILTHHLDCEFVGVKKVKTSSARSTKVHSAYEGNSITRFQRGISSPDNQYGPEEILGDWKCHSDCPVRILDEQSGIGGASRFFYTAKASRSEREAGLGPPLSCFRCKQQLSHEGPHIYNNHPTVKPIELMRYLIRLVSPPNGTVLDPFVGSGTTLIAARLENMNAFGIEKDKEMEPIIKGRLSVIPSSIDSFGSESNE